MGIDDKKTKEENIDIIQQKVTVLEERLDDQRFPREEEEVELEAGKKLVKILPIIITSLMPIKIAKDPQQERTYFEDRPSTSQSSYQTYNPVTFTSSLDFEILWQKAITRFGFSKEKPENNEKLAKRIWDINQSRWEYCLEQHDDSMIHTYRSELDILKKIGNKLSRTKTDLFEEKSPIFLEGNKSKVKILPFEDENEFYQCAEPWGIKRDDSLQKIEATLIVAERNTRERLSDIFILTTRECENLEKFHHDLVEIDKLQWYMDEVFLQPSEISMNTSQKKTIPKTLVTPLLEGHKIEWAEITEDTLKEFPHLTDRLKMQGLIQFMEKHPIAREEALAQLHRKAKDPTHEALTSFLIG